MNQILKCIAIAAVLFLTASPVAAETFLIGGYCANLGCPAEPTVINTPTVFGGFSATELNSASASAVPFGTASTYFADPGTTWIWAPTMPYSQFSYYVSAEPGTGPGNFSHTAAPGFYNYYSTFTLPYLDEATGDIVGMLTVAADDTTDVWLNGFLLTPEGYLGSDAKCADGVPTCTVYNGLFIQIG